MVAVATSLSVSGGVLGVTDTAAVVVGIVVVTYPSRSHNGTPLTHKQPSGRCNKYLYQYINNHQFSNRNLWHVYQFFFWPLIGLFKYHNSFNPVHISCTISNITIMISLGIPLLLNIIDTENNHLLWLIRSLFFFALIFVFFLLYYIYSNIPSVLIPYKK